VLLLLLHSAQGSRFINLFRDTEKIMHPTPSDAIPVTKSEVLFEGVRGWGVCPAPQRSGVIRLQVVATPAFRRRSGYFCPVFLIFLNKFDLSQEY
jgi:hypothetical protein